MAHILKPLNCEDVYKSFENMLSSVFQAIFEELALKASSLRSKETFFTIITSYLRQLRVG